MFDITSSKLLILAIVALIVVGPKDLPVLLRTVGRYLTFIRRHAADFRSQLDEIMRDVEFDQLKNEIEGVHDELRATIDNEIRALDRQVETAHPETDGAPTQMSPTALPAASAAEESGGLSSGWYC